MKKFIYVIGFIGAAMLVGGVTLKVLNMSGGYELYMIGLVLILLGFMPFLVINKNRETGTSLDRWKSIAGVVSSVVVSCRAAMKRVRSGISVCRLRSASPTSASLSRRASTR